MALCFMEGVDSSAGASRVRMAFNVRAKHLGSYFVSYS